MELVTCSTCELEYPAWEKHVCRGFAADPDALKEQIEGLQFEVETLKERIEKLEGRVDMEESKRGPRAIVLTGDPIVETRERTKEEEIAWGHRMDELEKERGPLFPDGFGGGAGVRRKAIHWSGNFGGSTSCGVTVDEESPMTWSNDPRNITCPKCREENPVPRPGEGIDIFGGIKEREMTIVDDAMAKELEHRRWQCNDLQRCNTALVIENRALKRGDSVLRGYVEAFHHAFDQPVGLRPGVIPESVGGRTPEQWIRLRAELVLEEAFEFARACFVPSYSSDTDSLSYAWILARRAARETPVDLDIVAAADALADVMYVAQGAFITFGIDDGPVLAEVQRSNLAKTNGPIDPITGKKGKPPGWTPPDIAGVLRRQGWTP